MAKKVYISAGHSANDPGAVKHVVERDEVWIISNMVAEEVENLGIVAYRDKWNYGWRDTVNEANGLGVDLFVEFHENAGGGNGAEVIIHNSANQYIADYFRAAFLRVGQEWRRTIVDPSFWVLKYTNAKACIVEVAFVDNWDDIKDFDEEHEKRKLAAEMAKAIAEILGVKVEASPAPTPKPNKPNSTPQAQASVVYRVQIGAFKERANADAMLEKVKAAGFNAFTTIVDNLYKVQVGAFTKKANADAMLGKVKASGFDGFISILGSEKPNPIKPTPTPTKPVTKPTTPKQRKISDVYNPSKQMTAAEAIKAGQAISNIILNRNIAEDGVYGADTHANSVGMMQWAMNQDYGVGLKVDFKDGPLTHSALGYHTVRLGEKQYMVTALEVLLLMHGYNPHGVEVPGQFGSGLAKCLHQYQADSGLVADEIAGRNTFLQLIK